MGWGKTFYAFWSFNHPLNIWKKKEKFKGPGGAFLVFFSKRKVLKREGVFYALKKSLKNLGFQKKKNFWVDLVFFGENLKRGKEGSPKKRPNSWKRKGKKKKPKKNFLLGFGFTRHKKKKIPGFWDFENLKKHPKSF